MAEQAEVFVKNMFDEGDIRAVRKLGDGTIDKDVTIAYQDEEMIPLIGTDASLIIFAPSSVPDIQAHHLKMKSQVDLAVSHSRSNSSWAIKIEPNNLPPDAPTTVNVNVGDEET